jgi:type II secretory pathway pseudopilin PulG
MIRGTKGRLVAAFSLVEVVVAIGIVSFSILATFGLLSVANDANKKARDEGMAARLASNEFDRLRCLNKANFPSTYITRFFDADLNDLGTSNSPKAAYSFGVTFVYPPPDSGTGDVILNAEVRYPPQAPAANQNVYRFSSLMNFPSP